MADILHDHVHVDRRVGQLLKHAGGYARLVRHADEGDLGLILVERHAANHDVFHALSFFLHEGSGVVVEAGANFENDTELLGELHRARLHHLGAEAGEFEHLVVRNFLEFFRRGHDARVAGVDAIDVRVNLAEVGLEYGRQRDRREVGAAAAQRGDVALARFALESGDDGHVAGVEQRVDFPGRDVADLRL